MSELLAQAGQAVPEQIMYDPGMVEAGYTMSPMVSLFYFAIWLLMIIGFAKIFMKAGRSWWEAIIPIYNLYVMIKIAQKPGWWLLLFFIPFVNIIIWVMLTFAVARAYNHGGLFAIGMIFFPFIFYLILGFGSSEYQYAVASSDAPTVGEPGAQVPEQPAAAATPDQPFEGDQQAS